MDIVEKIIEFKEKLEKIKNDKSSSSLKIEKGILSKILVMANIAEMCIYSNTNVPDEDRNYFEGRVSVGRYFGDWGLDWVTDYYIEITEFIKENHWN